MSQETERKQGIFVIAAFDRMFARERKNQDGTFSKTHYVGLIIRSDTETRLCEVRTNIQKSTSITNRSKSSQCKCFLVHLKTTSTIRTKHKPVSGVRRCSLN